MPLQNRVTPFGDIVAISQRGMFTGNRGIIHDPATRTLLARRWATKTWIVCAREYKGARVFFTTLGHPEDFSQASMRRLVVNGILWALGREIPSGGGDATPVTPYVAPESFDLSKVPKGE